MLCLIMKPFVIILQKTIKFCPDNKAFLNKVETVVLLSKSFEANFEGKEDCFSI